MLVNADVDITRVIEDLASHGVEGGYLVPTATALDKGIMDAHQSLRSFLKAKLFHDFDVQSQGEKEVYECKLLGARGWIPTKVSLYRPNTKNGDPRIWIYGLNEHARVNNLLVLLVVKGQLFVVNASGALWKTMHSPSTDFSNLIASAADESGAVEQELLELLRDIWSKGFIPSTNNADNGVGDTLENLLGIKRNSSKDPDYKGIEIKGSRKGVGGSSRVSRSNFFSLVPNWDLSVCKNGSEIVERYGYLKLGKKTLQVTLDNKPNPQGLYLALSNSEAEVENLAQVSGVAEKVVLWKVEDLQRSLSEKHRATFWVKAESRKTKLGEEFHYQDALITSKPLVQNFGPLVAAGKISMDYTFSWKLRKTGKPYLRDHGYLWKIHSRDFPLIFPAAKSLQLSTPDPTDL